MQQVVQDLRRGQLKVAQIPDPIARPGRVVIANAASVISAGTERMVRELAKKSLLQKARERPDHVRRVLQKLRQEGFFKTVEQVRSKLAEPIALGYSSAGVVLACGDGVQEFKPGQRVASNGPHAGVVSVPKHLCAHIPDGVPFEQAAFAVLGSIALQGVRLARVGLGDTVFVIGLGLVGQIAVMLLRAAGCRVVGTDLDGAKCERAEALGAERARPGMSGEDVERWTRGLGADAVVVAAATRSDAPINLAGEAVRKKGRVVVVGAVGMSLTRQPYYLKEAELVVSCSYGPGRYDPQYEELGRDYPAAYVRWTEQRNMQAVLDLMAGGGLDVGGLITHRFAAADAEQAYQLIDSGTDPYFGIVLRFPTGEEYRPARKLELQAPQPRPGAGLGCIGAGGFARAVLLPQLRAAAPEMRPIALCSAGGLSAAEAGASLGFERAVTDEDEIFADPEIDAVVVATPHNLHAAQVVKAIAAGKHVFVEKPLALTVEEVERIEQALAGSTGAAPLVMVGFNRRFSAAAQRLKQAFSTVSAPLTVSVRFNAGELPPEHWTQEASVGGGRILGEACHAIDLATFLTGSPPVRVFAESIGGDSAPQVTDDQCFITLRHADGSVSSIAYLAGGDLSFPKERVEVFGGGRVGVIDDFREAVVVADGRPETTKYRGQDKGHRAELKAFASAVATGGPPPIPWAELRAVSLAAILAVRSLREGIPFEIPTEPLVETSARAPEGRSTS